MGRFPGFKKAKEKTMPFQSFQIAQDLQTLAPEAPAPLAQSLGVVFDGPGSADTSLYPPDSILAVGPSHVVVCINDVIGIYSKTGAQQGSLQHFTSFFSSLGVGNFLFDPRVLYDHNHGRFVIVADALSTFPFTGLVTDSHVLVAVSQTSDPTGMWNKFALDFKGQNSTNTKNTWADFPTLGLSTTAIYITTNQFEFCTVSTPDSCNFSDAWIKVIGLQELLTGNSALNITTFTDVRTAQGEKAGAIQPAVTFGASSDEFFVAAFFPADENITSSQVLNIFSVNTNGTPLLTKLDLAVPTYTMPPEAQQPGTSIPIASGDYRPVNAVWRINSLWFAQTVADSTGSAAISRWYELAASSISTVAVKQMGTVLGSGNAYYPAVTVNANGDAVIVFTTSSCSQFASAAYTGRVASDVSGTTRTPVIYRQGTSLYDTTPRPLRWGDYSGAVIDPSDGTTWGIAEYAIGPNPNYRTAVGQIISVPPLIITPSTVTFSELPLGSRATPVTLTVTNIGTQSVNLGAAAISGKDSADFQWIGDGCSNLVLAQGNSCTMGVGFSPSGLGIRVAQLSLPQGSAGSPQGTVTIPLGGRGVSLGLVSLSAASLSFGPQLVGTTSAPKTVVLANTGSGQLGILGVTVSGDFAQTNTCVSGGNSSGFLAVGSSCNISVTFIPRQNGAAQGQISISHDASGSPTVVSLSGAGVAPQTTLSTGALSFSSQRVGRTSPTQTVTLSNTGNATLTLSSITINGDFLQTNNCGTAVSAGSACNINVAFSPSATGPRSGQLTVNDNAPNSPHSVSLTGTGIAPQVTLSPANLTFPPQLVGTTSNTQSATITNTGTDSLNITSITADGEFMVNSNCGSSLALGAICSASVTFHPTWGGGKFGGVTLVDDAPGSPHRVSLSGTGSDFSLGSFPSSATVTAGQSATFSLSVTPIGQFSGTVSLSCSGAPSSIACSVAPTTIALDGKNSQTTNVAVTTTAKGIFPQFRQPPRGAKPQTEKVYLVVACALVLTMLAGFRRGSRQRVRLALGFSLVLVFLGTGCNLFNRSSGTQPGSYTLTLTGVSSSLQRTTTVTLVVTRAP